MRVAPTATRLATGAMTVLLALPSCQQQEVRQSRLLVPEPVAPGTSGMDRSDSFLRVSLEPLGELANDAFTLPLVSPDGRFVAVQVESNADWPTLTASRGQARKVVGRIAWYEAVNGALLPRGDRAGPLLLGRSADSNGFLVESPEADGSRAIGRMPWSGGEVDWLVRDGAVNAWGVLGPRGELAWSRRSVESAIFELWMDRPEGRLSFTTSAEHSWICPRFDGDGNLFAWRLHDGTLSAGFLPLMTGRGEDQESLLPALRLRPVTLRGSAERAYLAMTPTDGIACSAPPQQLLFFHPDLGRMCLWDASTDDLSYLADRSVGAIVVTNGGRPRALVAIPSRLLEQPLPAHPSDTPIRVIEGLWIPRSQATPDGRITMVSPARGRLTMARLFLYSAPPSSSSSSSSPSSSSSSSSPSSSSSSPSSSSSSSKS